MTTGDVVYSLKFSLIKILPEPGFKLRSTAGESSVLTACYINKSISTKVVSTYWGYLLTAHNIYYVLVTGGRKPVTLRSLVRRLLDIAIQVDITCCDHQLCIDIALVNI